MEISAPPGTALILEPGGLDAPPEEQGEGNGGEGTGSGGGRGAEEEGEAEEERQRAEEEEEAEEKAARSRVIVRRRATGGGGFFRRKEGEAENEAANRERSRSKPKYSTIRSGIIKLTPESMKCKLYCRGPKCIYCNPENWGGTQQAIRGLYSNWITDNLLAMARPTERTFGEFDLIGQFKKVKVKTIFNLQCVNEHDYCGPPLVAHTGFSYDPEVLMRKKLFYYNFAIPDFGTVPVQSILNIAKVIWFSLRYGRVAIHCHAGLGRTGTLIACFLVWSKCLYTSDAIDLVREARPNSIQSVDQINVVEEFAYHVHKYGTALPSAFYSSSNGISLRQMMANQRQFLPNEEARRFAHIPKLLYILGDRLLRLVFEGDGVHYAPPCGHHARSCTFGTICVNWRRAFTKKGKLQVRQIVNLLARCSAFPYEKDQALVNKFQQLSLVIVDQMVTDLDAPQLVSLLNAFLESIKKPYCSRRALIEALGHFSPDNPTGPIPELDEEETVRGGGGAIDKEDLELLDQLEHPKGGPEEGEEFEEGEGRRREGRGGGEEMGKEGTKVKGGEEEKKKKGGEMDEEKMGAKTTATDEEEGMEGSGFEAEKNGMEAEKTIERRPESAFQGTVKRHSITMEKCAENYGGASLDDGEGGGGGGGHLDGMEGKEEKKASGSRRQEETATMAQSADAPFPTEAAAAEDALTIVSSPTSPSINTHFGALQFDNHDSHTNKEANLSADWQCIVFYVCNLLSYLTGENYDAVVDLLTFWFTGDSNRDVKQAVYCHMRDLFARNMRQQEQQAAELRRQMGLPEKQPKNKRG